MKLLISGFVIGKFPAGQPCSNTLSLQPPFELVAEIYHWHIAFK